MSVYFQCYSEDDPSGYPRVVYEVNGRCVACGVKFTTYMHICAGHDNLIFELCDEPPPYPWIIKDGVWAMSREMLQQLGLL